MADIEEAIEDAIEAEEEKAEAIEELAEAQALAVTATAAQTAVATAEAAAALANETAALAEVEAAKTVQQNEGQLEWLKNHAALTENSLQSIQAEQMQAREERAKLMEALTGFQAALQSLTPQHSTPASTTEAEPLTVNPESAGEGGLKELAEPPNLQAAAKRLKRWI